MTTHGPLEAVTRLVNAMDQGDVATALSNYAPEASLVVRPGVVATETSELREALASFVALKPILETEAHQIAEAGEVALYCSRWILRGTDPAGNSVEVRHRSSDILRRLPNGTWLIALDNPWGPDIVA